MHRKFFSFFYFAITVVILIAVLKILNWLPMAIQKDAIRRYSSVEEVRLRLNIKNIYVPSYFPQNFTWPPSEILAQNKPFTAVVMEFKHRERGDIALIISQVAAGANFVPDKKIKILQVKEKVTYPLKGRNAVLEVGLCKNDEPCSRISWDEGKYRVTVVMKSPPFDLIKVADSMLR